jgi:hypothetical protein
MIGKTFEYDSESHLTPMNGGTVAVVYDGFGNRVPKTAFAVGRKITITMESFARLL